MNESPRIIALPPETGFSSVRVATVSPDGRFVVVDGRPLGASDHTDTGLIVRIDPLALATDAAIATAIAAGGVERLAGALPLGEAPATRHRVLKDTLWGRAKDAGLGAAVCAAVGAMPTAQRFDWDNQSWFWSDNVSIRAVLAQIGATPEQIEAILATDPLAP